MRRAAAGARRSGASVSGVTQQRRDGLGKRDNTAHATTRSSRVNGRIVREYVGRGLVGDLGSREDATRREARRAPQTAAMGARQREREAERQVRELVATIDWQAAALMPITPTTAGYQRSKRGVWRRRRGHGTR